MDNPCSDVVVVGVCGGNIDGVAAVDVVYGVLLPYDVVLSDGVGVVVGVEVDMPNARNAELPVIGVGVECRCEFELQVVDSCLTGCEDDDADAEDTARARPACVSRRRLGPSLTFGWV